MFKPIERIMEHQGVKYRLRRSGSIYTSRTGKEDIIVQQPSPGHWGARHDGTWFWTIRRVAVETGEVLRGDQLLPQAVLDEVEKLRAAA